MHAALNDTTAWGSLFKAYSALLRYTTEPEPYRGVCRSLVEACRHTHEVFATYTGVYLADRAAGQSLLAAHRNYLTYHSDACELAKGMPPGSQLEWYAVISAARACMQSEGLLMALRVGLDQSGSRTSAPATSRTLALPCFSGTATACGRRSRQPSPASSTRQTKQTRSPGSQQYLTPAARRPTAWTKPC
jgi:hypothetical protein